MPEEATKLLRVPAYSQIDTMCQWWELRKLRIAGKSSFSSQCQGSTGTITPAVLAPIIARDCDTILRAVSGGVGISGRPISEEQSVGKARTMPAGQLGLTVGLIS